MHSRKMRLTGVLLMLAAFAAVACTKEVVKEVEVPGETIIVEKEVPVEVVVEKEVVKEIVVEKIIEVEKIVEVEVEAMAKQTYQEAPMLAQLVAAGILDPVEERIPVNPWVLPVEEIGLYGGTLTRAYFCPTDIWNFLRLSRAPIARFTTDGSGSVPSVVAGWEVSNEGRTWTFELRKGMRWSDGMPATMEDVKFAWEDVITNTDLLETPPPLLSLEDIAPEFKVIDELHWSLTFHKPNYVFLQAIPQTGFDWQRMLLPKHYLKQFHADYADAATLQAIVDGGPNLDGNQVKWTHKTEWDDWKDAFRHHFHGYMEDTQMPRLHPWILKTRYGVQRMIAERNAYFYGVDPAGNQLPYIDRIVWECVENADVVQLKAVAGELTLQGRHVQMETYPLLQENRNKGGYTVKLWPEFGGTNTGVSLNFNWKGPEGEYFNMAEFRQALSVAVDRDLMNEVNFLGTGTPRTPMPPPGHGEYPGSEWELKWIEYNPEKAMAMLDAIGLDKKDSGGFRVMSNGDRLSFEICVWEGFSGWMDSTEMAIKDWEDIGIHATMKVGHRAQIGQQWNNNECMAQATSMDSAGFTFAVRTANTDIAFGIWAPLWGDWLSGGSQAATGAEGAGEKPPQYWIDLHEDHLLGKTLPPEEANELAKRIYRDFAEGAYIISFIGMVPQPMVVSNNIGNFPAYGFTYWPLRTPSNAFPEQWFLRQR